MRLSLTLAASCLIGGCTVFASDSGNEVPIPVAEPTIEVTPRNTTDNRYDIVVVGVYGMRLEELVPYWDIARVRACGDDRLRPYAFNERLAYDGFGRPIPAIEGSITCG